MKDRLIEMLREIHANDGSLFDANICDSEVVMLLEDIACEMGINPDEFAPEQPELDPISLHRYVEQADRLTHALQGLREWKYGGGDSDA